jgi:CRP-like cAMP-binding protein
LVPTEEIYKALEAADLLKGAGPAAVESLALGCRTRRYRKGQSVFFQGDPSDAVLVVAEGRLKVSVSSEDGSEILLDLVEPGQSVGDVGVLDGQPRSADVQALADTAVVVIPADALWACMDEFPDVARAAVRALAARLRRLTDDASNLVFLDLPRRVAKLILAELDGQGTDRIALGLSQAEIGQRLGATRQSVNTALRAFVRRGWIQVAGQQIDVLDAQAMRRFLKT